MKMRNAPAHKSEGADCLLLAGLDTGAYSTAHTRIQYLAARHGLTFHRAALLAPIAFGVTANA